MPDHAEPDPAMLRAVLGDRALFPALEADVYLGHAAIAPPSLRVEAAVAAVLDAYARRGIGAWFTFQEQRERLRGKLARLVDAATSDEIALVASTTAGVTAIAQCLPWRRGERVLVLRGEFPTNVTPWQRAAEVHGLEVVFHDVAPFHHEPEAALARVGAELARGLRLVAVSAVQFQTGLRMPLAELGGLCHAHGAELFVDAIQALGAVPFSVRETGVDYLACGSHKWLMGLEGAGFVYVRQPLAEHLRPVLAGWLSHEDGTGFLFEGAGHLRYDRPIRKTPSFLEGGAQNVVGFVALEAALDILQEEIGIAAVWHHVDGYLEALDRGCRARGFTSLRTDHAGGRSGILGLLPPPDVPGAAVRDALGAVGIVCTMPDGVLRFAPHWPNARAEVDRVLAAVDQGLATLRA